MGESAAMSRLMLVFGLCSASAAHALDVAGRVVGVDDGRAVAQAMVTVAFPAGTPGPAAITVFSGADGGFRLAALPDPLPAGTTLRAEKPGYRLADPAGGAPRLKPGKPGAPQTTTLILASTDNIAPGAPASAWFGQMPAGAERDLTLTSCTSCHQMPSPRVREYASKIEAVANGPDGDRKAIEEWRKVVRHEAWRTIVKYMRSKHYSVFPLESPVNLDAIDWAAAQNADFNFFNARQGEIIAQYLAQHFPRSTASLARDDYAYGAPLGVTARTTIREYALPADALVREMVPAPRSPYLWGADVRRNLIVRLDPATGATKWYRPEFDGSTGPHTIVPDDDGRLWVSMIDNDQFGRFDPATEKWTLWTLRPSNLPDTAAMAGSAIVHDMSIDSRGHLARDAYGRIWVTIVGSNQMGTLHPDTGEVAFHDTNRIEGLSPINHLIYATVLSADGKHAWYSQLNGSVGSLDTKTNRVEKLIPFPEGAGPRRMARDNAGNLWVALFGSGQVARIEMASGKVTGTFDLPDRSAAPYAVTWDERRKAVWVANANSDVVYRLDPKRGASTVYPLPRPMAYLRQIAIDRDGRLVASYGNYPEASGPSMGVVIDVGD
ncbi:MAG TPA: SMP-30/gluconolactonase/LRE family protein [Nevskiaceae bacterium]|nr:SMP-30/gluconolactonase/LRE family protein [Nevskiaceae bacterium]